MSASQDELLVNGFIRESKSLLTNTIIIPLDIISLCCLFFKRSFKILIFNQSQYSHERHIKILDVASKKLTKLKYKYITAVMHRMHPKYISLCYIPQFLSQNALFCSDKWQNIFIIPFRYKTNCDVITSSSIIRANQPSGSYGGAYNTKIQSLFCGIKYGVIYERYGIMYQCKLQNTEQRQDVQKIECNDIFDIGDENIKHLFGAAEDYLIMAYSANREIIFAIHQHKDGDSSSDSSSEEHDHDDVGTYYTKLVCGIFDLNQKKWRRIENLKVRSRLSHFWQACFDGYGMVYAVSNIGEIAGYDINKNK
eukprot:174457_1